MLENRDIELFNLMATSFVLRGRRDWVCSELVGRLAALGMPTDCHDALKKLCDEGWLSEISEDRFCLTRQGEKVARAKVGPFAAGEF